MRGPGPAHRPDPCPGREHLSAAGPGTAGTGTVPALRACGLRTWALPSSAAGAGTPAAAPNAQGSLPANPGTGRGSVSCSHLSGRCRVALRLRFHLPTAPAGRSLSGAVEKFGALLGLPLFPSPFLVTGVNTACFSQARGRLRPECGCFRRSLKQADFESSNWQRKAPKPMNPFLKGSFLLLSCTAHIICVSSPDRVRKVRPLFFKFPIWQV